jgi:hypothetical protein
MAFYEILIRGNADGTLSGAHVQEWVTDGANGDGSPRHKVGDPAPIAVEALAAYVGQQFAEVAAQAAQRAAAQAELDALRAEVIALRGTPTFSPNALIALFSEADTAAIVTTISGSAELRALYHALSNRAATGDRPIPIDSPMFLAGLAGLKAALGEARVGALFAGLNIDLATGRYLQA